MKKTVYKYSQPKRFLVGGDQYHNVSQIKQKCYFIFVNFLCFSGQLKKYLNYLIYSRRIKIKP